MLTGANLLGEKGVEGLSSKDGQEKYLKEFISFVGSDSFPCVGAKAALNSGAYRFAVYEELASNAITSNLASDLRAFVDSEMFGKSNYATYVAVFRRPQLLGEEAFERLLWSQLQRLHELDNENNAWDPRVSSDPSNAHFSFSFARQAFYVVGMHQSSSRLSRQFRWPTLVFNPHEQFQRLREDGDWERMQATIRTRDIRLQGSSNPMLDNFGDSSEARQYSGRAVGDNWSPSFKASNRPPSSKCPYGP